MDCGRAGCGATRVPVVNHGPVPDGKVLRRSPVHTGAPIAVAADDLRDLAVETPNERLGRSLERIEASLGNVIRASLRKRAPQGSARRARRPSPPLTCALAKADWQLWRAAMPLAGVQTRAQRKKELQKLTALNFVPSWAGQPYPRLSSPGCK
jgi:hypothetical protein